MTVIDPQKTDEALGSLIRLHRKTAGLSQEELGRAVGTSAQQIQKFEAGQNRVSVHRLLAISHALGIEAIALLSEVEKSVGQLCIAHPDTRARELEFLGSSAGRLLVSSLVEMADDDFSASIAQVAAHASRSRDAT